MVPAISADMEWSLRLTTLPGPTIFILFKLYNVMLDGERETCRNATQNLERGNAECEEKIDERGHLKREGILETRAHFCSFIKGYSVRPFAGYSVRPFAFLKSNFALHLFCENK